MNKVFAVLAGASALIATTVAASAQRASPPPSPPPSATSQTLQAPYIPRNPNLSPDQSRPLFWLGQLPVVVWAPVQPHYSSKMNGSQAENALLWSADPY